MYRSIIILVAIFILPFQATAQKMKIGIYADPQISWLSPEAREVKGEGTKFGFQGGLIIERYFQDNYAINLGVGAGSQGGKLLFEEASTIKAYDEVDSLPPGTTVDYKLKYITVPFGLKLKTNQIGYFSYYALIGFTNQFNIDAKASSNEGTLDEDVIKKEIGFFNMAYHIGMGMEYNISENTALTLGAVYHNGFIDITDNNNANVHSRVVSIRIGILF
jgi:opacity protein-like surface antigen